MKDLLIYKKAKVSRYVASSLGFMAAATSNYVLNRLWTFESENRLRLKTDSRRSSYAVEFRDEQLFYVLRSDPNPCSGFRTLQAVLKLQTLQAAQPSVVPCGTIVDMLALTGD
jgi:hypothetical protein